MKEELLAYHWINSLRSVDIETKYRLLATTDILSLYENMDERFIDEIIKKSGEMLNFKQKFELLDNRMRERCCEEIYKMREMNIKITFPGDDIYPGKLLNIKNPPLSLYLIGELPNDRLRSVAVIGTRNCTPYGIKATRIFVDGFVKDNVQVISGMARGIDTEAHTRTLFRKGKTFAVLGSGIDVIYPPENEKLYYDIINNGGVISEYPIGIPAKPSFFPDRNRLIAGLSDAVLVVEAGEQSGAMITVSYALDQGKEIFAVPGRIDDQMSKSCLSLIEFGAHPAIDPREIVNIL